MGGGKKFAILRDCAFRRAGVPAARARRGGVRRLAGRRAHGVIMTFIMGEFSGGPWTSAVQGPIFLKIFFLGGNGACRNTGRANLRGLCFGA